jgi:hypothetical protein
MINVISDKDWIGMMNRLNFGIQANVGANMRMNRRMSLLIGGGWRQGLSGLDDHFRADFSTTKYQGQYNPQWGAPGLTNSQSFYLNIGTTFLLNKE